MLRERGFVMPMMGWVYIGIAAAFLAMSVGLRFTYNAWQAEKQAFATYKGGVEALGRAAEIETAKTNLANMKKKEIIDEEAVRVAARHAADLRRLRDDLASRSFVPGPRAEAKRPDVACFPRADLDRALREFAEGAAGLVGEGAAAVSDLDLAKRWAK